MSGQASSKPLPAWLGRNRVAGQSTGFEPAILVGSDVAQLLDTGAFEDEPTTLIIEVALDRGGIERGDGHDKPNQKSY